MNNTTYSQQTYENIKVSSNQRCKQQTMRYAAGNTEFVREIVTKEWGMEPSPMLLKAVQVGTLQGRSVGNKDHMSFKKKNIILNLVT